MTLSGLIAVILRYLAEVSTFRDNYVPVVEVIPVLCGSNAVQRIQFSAMYCECSEIIRGREVSSSRRRKFD